MPTIITTWDKFVIPTFNTSLDIRQALFDNALADLTIDMDTKYYQALTEYTVSNQTEFVGIWPSLHKPTYGVI